MSKFNSGDKVIVKFKNTSYQYWDPVMDNLVGQEVTYFKPIGTNNCFILHDSGIDQYYSSGTHENGWYITEVCLELVCSIGSIKQDTTDHIYSSGSSIPQCPRCNGKLIKKEAEEPFTGKKYMIDKCKDCGWC